MAKLDVITIGRAGVDLYGSQIGGRLEDMGSFDKYIGGSPTNIACGTARLGLKSGLITRVGDEHMGRFIREQLQREGVDVQGVKTDPERLTALVLLGIRDEEQFPLIFYRENCADMALCEDDIEESYIASARAIVPTGTHLSHANTRAAVVKALKLARRNGVQTALDIDYRPNLWGVAGHGDGESRFVESAAVTAQLQLALHYFDLIVGTEEEFHIAGGSTNTIEALRAVRAVSDATLVCKRGASGAVAFEGAIPDSLDDGQAGPGFPIEVFNVLGAGDGFFSGLLKGWLDGEDWPTALKYANACGAFAVSRHGCTPAYPSLTELEFFLERGVKRPDLRNDEELEQVHWATNRKGDWSHVRTFAFDHRMQLEEMEGYTPEKGAAFKELCLDAALQVQDGQPGYGILCDNRIGRSALHRASGTGLWIGRPTELPGSRPIEFEPELGPDFGQFREWARENVVKLLVFCHPDDDAETRARQERRVKRLFTAARRVWFRGRWALTPRYVLFVVTRRSRPEAGDKELNRDSALFRSITKNSLPNDVAPKSSIARDLKAVSASPAVARFGNLAVRMIFHPMVDVWGKLRFKAFRRFFMFPLIPIFTSPTPLGTGRPARRSAPSGKRAKYNSCGLSSVS